MDQIMPTVSASGRSPNMMGRLERGTVFMTVVPSGGRTRRLRDVLEDQMGATAVEYGLMVALIAIIIFAAVVFVGSALRSDFDCVGSNIEAAPSTPTCTP